MWQTLSDYSIYLTIWLCCLHRQTDIQALSPTTLLTLQFAAYWVLGAFCAALDLSQTDRWRVELPRSDGLTYKQILPQVLSTHAFVTAGSWFYATTLVTDWDDRVLGAAEWWGKLTLVFFLFDLLFYCGHRAMHHKLLYKHMHKLHHQSLAAMGISGYYMTWSDACLEFLVPTLVPFFVVGHNKSLLLATVLVGQLNGVVSHSGHRLPCFPYTTAHLDHHLQLQVNYGIGLLDWLLQTSSSGEGRAQVDAAVVSVSAATTTPSR